MKILVTGANGYMGTGIVKQLLDDECDVIAVDFSTDNVDSRACRKAVDLFSLENPYEELGKPEVILHLAWRDGFRHDSINHVNDFPKHYQFLEQMMEAGVKRICVMGSMHEIGFFEGSIDENTPTNPQTLYGISKNALRNAAALCAQKTGTIFQWIRGYYIVGNSDAGSSIFSKITSAVKEGKEEFPFTMGLNQYDFIDYEDFCKQVAAVVEQDDINGIINCCSGRPMTLSERVEKFIRDNNYSIKLKYGAFPDRPYDSKAVWGNNSKIEAIMKNREVQNQNYRI